MSSESNEDYLNQVREEVRAQAQDLAQRPLLARAPTVPARGSGAGPIERGRLDYRIGEFTDQHYVAFVESAFRAILKRAPEAAEAEAQLRLLGAGHGKAEILGNLRWSDEGRRIGARIGGLLPRYALAKAGRLPVLGYLLQWGLALAGLPLLARHQRALEAMSTAADHAAAGAAHELRSRTDQLAAAQALLAQRVDDLLAFAHELNRARDAQAAALGDVEAALRGRIEALEATTNVHVDRLEELAFLRQRVYAINHWSHYLTEAFAHIEEVAGRRSREHGSAAARAADALTAVDATRAARHAAWAQQFSGCLPAQARVLTLGSSRDWLAQLAVRGLRAAGADPNDAPGERVARAGDEAPLPRDLLARSEDHSVDGLSVLALPALAKALPVVELLGEAARVLRPGGALLLAFSREPELLADALLGIATPSIALDLLERALDTAGFVGITRMDAADGTPAVLARAACA